jgi:cbb3-type cytochrome oxidase maturation protein
MDILFLLVPLSVLLALAVMAVLAWAVWAGQFEDMEREGQRIFQDDEVKPNIQETQDSTKA